MIKYHFELLIRPFTAGRQYSDICHLGIGLLLYLCNVCFWRKYGNLFMICYFNDILAGLSFIAYVNLLLFHLNKRLRFKEGFVIIVVAGFFWEYCIPLVKKTSISDIYDVVAYLGGFAIYFMNETLVQRIKSYKNKK